MRKELTVQDVADIRAALDLAHDTADHGKPSRATLDKADRALDRVALAVASRNASMCMTEA